MTSVCDVNYRTFNTDAQIEKVVVDGQKITKVKLGENEYAVTGHHRNVNLYRILRNLKCKKCNCTTTKIPI